MRTGGPSAATLLLLLLYLTTRSDLTNGKIVKSRRSAPSTSQQIVLGDTIAINDDNDKRSAQFLAVHNPGRINNDVLSLVDSQSDVQGKNIGPLGIDQQVDQSKMVIVRVDDTMDLDTIQHALSVAEYEPQKINKKEKRKATRSFSINSDSTISNNENADLITPAVDSTYYEVPRTAQPKKILPSQYYSKSDHESPKSSETEPKVKARNVEYVYPVSTPSKTSRQRYTKGRLSTNPQISSSAKERKLENIPSPRVPPLYRSYSSLSGEPRRPNHFVESTITTTPSGDDYSTKATRRKKSRKRVVEKASNRSALPRLQDNGNSYASDTVKNRSAINVEGRDKSKRLGLVTKYDVAPRSFARSVKVNRESGLENLADEGAALIGSRGSNNRNPHPNSVKSNDGKSSGGYSRVADLTRSPLAGLNRKLYEKQDNRKGSTEQLRVGSNPLSYAEETKSVEYPETVTGRSLPSYKTHQITKETGSSEDRSLKIKSLQPVYTDNSESTPKVPSMTSGLDIYQNIKAPVVTLHSIGSVSSTVVPFTSPSPYSANLMFNLSTGSTMAPVDQFEVSTAYSWTSQTKLNNQKERDVEVKESEQKVNGEMTDGVAEATNVGSDEDEESKGDHGKYEIYETPDEGHRSSGGDHGIQNQYDGKKYDQRKADVFSEGTHESSHEDHGYQGGKEDAGGSIDAGGKGNGAGDSKFEKGDGTEHVEGHQEADGEKGEKAYKSWHEYEKADKGHSDKERKSNYYDETDGKEKGHKEEGGYHQQHQEGEKGQKLTEFGEKGEHQKGYSTKGQHFVHKKDEFEKRTEFFDEFHEDGEQEKDGEYYQEHENKKGGHEKVSHHDEGDHEEKYGKEEKHEKGKHYHDDKGHKITAGEDSHYDHDDMRGTKKKHQLGKKWTYQKGDDGKAGGKDQKSH